MALGVEGVAVGTWTSPSAVSGCTVVLAPEGTVGAVAVRGSAPGTREAAALSAAGKVEVCHGVVLAGGSAFGLAAADGVARWLEARGRGYPVLGAVVPIVGAAIVLDAAVLAPAERPDADAGWAACEAAGSHAAAVLPAEGRVGVGAGCTVAKVAGLEHAWRSGQGVAVRRAGGVTVGVVVANNALGEVVDEDGRWLARARVGDEVARFPEVDPFAPPTDAGAGSGGADTAAGSGGADTAAGSGAADTAAVPNGPTSNTVIGCIVTDARLPKRDVARVADLGHSGIARAVRPAHTSADGDALFCLATGQVAASVDLVAHLAADAVAEACRQAVRTATSAPLLPGGPVVPGLGDT
jgi:L-aminopeptidase/D-esterase-like protein